MYSCCSPELRRERSILYMIMFTSKWNCYSLVLLTLALGTFQEVTSQSLCGYYEEGTEQSITCSTPTANFTKFGPRIFINGIYEQTSYCDSNGNCYDKDPSRYTASYASNSETGGKTVTVHIRSVDRSMSLARCYRDGVALFSAICRFHIFITPSKPVCTGPEFVDGGRAVLVTCTSDRVYPTASCGIWVKEGGEAFLDNPRLSVQDNLTTSDQYPGDNMLTCFFKLNLLGIKENLFTMGVQFYARVPKDIYQSNIKHADKLPDMNLKATAVYNPLGTSRPVTFDPVTQELRVNIQVTSNPPPYSFSMSVLQGGSATPVSVPSDQFSVQFSGAGGSDHRGTIALTIATAALTSQKRVNTFNFTASNGVVGGTAFIDTFTWTRLDIAPTQPTCNGPELVDQGAEAIFTCTSDRVYPEGTCGFTLTANSPRLSKQPLVETTTVQSGDYPGHKEVTCEMRLPVAGTKAGTYQFQVEITPTDTSGNQSVFATTSALSLEAMKLHGNSENNEVFEYPESGDLDIDILVTGSPPPNKVILYERQNEAKTLPVPTRDFSWTYDKQAIAALGHVNLVLSNVNAEESSVKHYTLIVDNGVIGESEFEYRFSVNYEDENGEAPKSEANNMPLYAGAGAGGLVLILIIIVIIACVLMRRKRTAQSSDQIYSTAVPNGEFDKPYHYPNMGFKPEGEDDTPPYSRFPETSPYLVPIADRPVSEFSLPEYSEIYDIPKTNNQTD